MRKDFGAKPYTYPQPVLMIATYGEDGKPDVMNAAWGGISDDKEISICVSENHKTTENILKKGAFTVSMADVEHMTACDYVGIVSGNKEPDKFVKAGFTAEKSEKVDAPIIKVNICNFQDSQFLRPPARIYSDQNHICKRNFKMGPERQYFLIRKRNTDDFRLRLLHTITELGIVFSYNFMFHGISVHKIE